MLFDFEEMIKINNLYLIIYFFIIIDYRIGDLSYNIDVYL